MHSRVWWWPVVRSFAVAAIAAVALAGTACTDERSQGGATPAPPQQRDASQVLHVNLGGEPQTLDPQRAADTTSITVLRNIYAALLRIAPDLSLQPDLAREVPTVANGGISPDGLTYTFRLRDGLQWSDGAPLRAQAFVDGAKRLFDPAHANSYVDLYRVIAARGADVQLQQALAQGKQGAEVEALERAVAANLEVAAPDERTVVYRLNQRSSVFLSLATLWPLYPVRQDVIDAKGERWTEAGNLLSNGPFVLAKWQHGQQIELVRNDRYHGPAVALQSIRMDMISDAALALLAYGQGELDATLLGPTELVQVRGDQRQRDQFRSYPQLSTEAVYFNLADPLFANAQIRQAFASAINRNEYAEAVREGAVLPAFGWVPPGMPGHDAQAGAQYADAVDRGRALLKAAGHEGGAGIEVTVLVADVSSARNTATWLQQQWERNLGVRVNLVVRERAAYFADRLAGKFQVLTGGWGADYPDPENWLPQFRTGSGLNPGHFSDAAFDRLIDQAAQELDQARRLEHYRQAQRILIDQAAIAPLAYGRRNVLVQPWVQGLVTSSMEAEVPGDLFFDRVFIQGRR